MSQESQDLIDFVRSYREPIKLTEAASELNHLGNFGADWPRASYEHWIRELELLANKGKLTIDDKGMISVPRGEVAQTQMELFESIPRASVCPGKSDSKRW
jgi:hypothetical protein